MTGSIDYVTGDAVVYARGNPDKKYLANISAINAGDGLVPDSKDRLQSGPDQKSESAQPGGYAHEQGMCFQSSGRCVNVSLGSLVPSEPEPKHEPEGNGGGGGSFGNDHPSVPKTTSASVAAPVPGVYVASAGSVPIGLSPNGPISSAGSIFNGGGVLQPVPGKQLTNLQIAAQAAENSTGLSMVELATQKRAEIAAEAKADQSTLSNSYKNVPMGELAERFGRAKSGLDSISQAFADATGGMVPDARMWFKNTYANAADKAAAAQAVADDYAAKQASLSSSPFGNLFAPPGDGEAEAQAKIRALFTGSAPLSGANTSEALLARMVMYAGLPDDQKPMLPGDASRLSPAEAGEALAKRGTLKLTEDHELSFADGSKRKVRIQHNGYVLGGGKTSTDCSGFISSLLSAEGRKPRMTTLDLRVIYELKLSGHLPRPPKYEAKSEQRMFDLADGFTPVNLQEGEPLLPGDLIVHRLPWKPIGHVFMVRNYDDAAKEVTVIEASQTSTTVSERKFALSLDPPSDRFRHIRPGVMGLRFSVADSKTCKYREAK